MKILELLEPPENWTKCALARSSTGASVEPMDPNAKCWCLVGAIMYCYPPDQQWWVSMKLAEAIRYRFPEFGPSRIKEITSIFNDEGKTNHTKMLAVVRAANV